MPVGLEGENVAELSPRTPWFAGPTLADVLAETKPPIPEADTPLRLLVKGTVDVATRGLVVIG